MIIFLNAYEHYEVEMPNEMHLSKNFQKILCVMMLIYFQMD